jgi:hypothetical protein
MNNITFHEGTKVGERIKSNSVVTPEKKSTSPRLMLQQCFKVCPSLREVVCKITPGYAVIHPKDDILDRHFKVFFKQQVVHMREAIGYQLLFHRPKNLFPSAYHQHDYFDDISES